MGQIEEPLAEEVWRYEHLYNSSLKDYKDARKTYNSWKEILGNNGVEVEECMRKWRKMRDKFVQIKKSMKSCSGDAGGRKVPALYIFQQLQLRHKSLSLSLSLSVRLHSSLCVAGWDVNKQTMTIDVMG